MHKYYADCCEQNAEKNGELHRGGSVFFCFLPFVFAAALGDVYLSAHTGKGDKALGKPGIHTADSHACNGLGAKKADP